MNRFRFNIINSVVAIIVLVVSWSEISRLWVVIKLAWLLDLALLGAAATEAIVRRQSDLGLNVVRQLGLILVVAVDNLLLFVIVRVILSVRVLVTSRFEVFITIRCSIAILRIYRRRRRWHRTFFLLHLSKISGRLSMVLIAHLTRATLLSEIVVISIRQQ